MALTEPYGDVPAWAPERPRFRTWRLLLAWIVSAASVAVAAWILPGLGLEQTG
jgi:hypothetical protein